MTRRILISASALLLTLFLAACESPEQRAEKHYQRAVALLAEGDLPRAEVEFRNVFKADPTHREARRDYALALIQDHRRGGAARQLLFLVEQYPDDFEGLVELSMVLTDNLRWDEAERYSARAAETGADDPRVQAVQSVLGYRNAATSGDVAAQAAMADQAALLVQGQPDNLSLHRLLADWANFEGRERDALEHIDAALELSPLDMTIHQSRLAVLDSLGEFEELEHHLKELVRAFPDDPTTSESLVRWYLARDRADDAETFLRELVTTETTPQKIEDATVTLVRFIVTIRGRPAAIEELDRILADTQNPNLFRSIRAGLNFDEGDRDSAIAEMQAILADAPASDQARIFKVTLAHMLQTNGDDTSARELVEAVLEEDPSQVEALKMKAGWLITADDGDQAVLLLRRALDQAPRDADVMTLMASAHERNGNRDLMGEMLALAAEASNRAPVESLRLASFLAARDQFGPAEQALIEALRRAPAHVDLLRGLGQLYLASGKLAEARGVENRLGQLGGDLAAQAAAGMRLAILRAEDRNDDLVAMIEAIAAANPDSVDPAIAIVSTYMQSGDVARAEAALRNAREQYPDSVELRYAEGGLAASQNDFQTAREIYREVLEQRPSAVPAWLSLARTYTSEDNIAAGEAVIDEALTAVPAAPDLLWAKASYLERRGENDAAIEIFETLYAADTDSTIVANNLASMLASYREDEGSLDRAHTIARRLRGLEQPQFQDTYGWIAFRRGDLDEALDSLEPAAAGLTKDPLVQYHLGRVYEELERHRDAADQYRRVLQVLIPGYADDQVADTAARLATVLERAEAQ